MTEEYRNSHSNAPIEDLADTKDALIYDDETHKVDYLGLQARCVKAFGPPAGIMLRQLVFYTGKSALEDGWLWKTEAEMEAETGLSRGHQREARKVLTSMGVLEEMRKGVPCRMHYRVNLTKLMALLELGTSTLNQWKRGMRKDRKTGKLYTPKGVTLNPNYRENGNTVLSSEDGTTDPTSEDRISNPTSEDRITDRAIQRLRQESTSEDDNQETPVYNRELKASKEPFNTEAERSATVVGKGLDFSSNNSDATTMLNLADVTNGRKTEAPDPLKANRAYMLLDDEGSKAGQLLRARADHVKVAEQLAVSLEGDSSKAATYVGAVEDFLKMAPELTKEAV